MMATFTIALLNVRCLTAKLPDIEQDVLKCAMVSPVVQDNQASLRCDRALANQKGGVMISVPQSMQPTDIY